MSIRTSDTFWGKKGSKILRTPSSGSLCDRVRAGIDEICIKNPKIAELTIYVAVGLQIAAHAYKCATAASLTTATMLNFLVDDSIRMTTEELEALILGGTPSWAP